MCRELAMKFSKILCEFFHQNISRDCRATVVPLSSDIRASVVNLSPPNSDEFTMQNFCDTPTNVVRVSYDGRVTVLKPEDQWSCKRSPESAAYTNKHV